MFWYKLLAFLRGYLVLVIRGPFLVRFVNLATSEGIYLWDLRRPSKDLLVVKIGVKGFIAARPLLRKTKSQVRIRQRCGLPFLWMKLRRRRMWLLGMVLTMVALAVLSRMVLFVRLEGVDDPHGLLLHELRQYGVTVGANRGKLEKKLEVIEEEMKIAHPEFLWVDTKLQGVLFRMEVVQRKTPPPRTGSADLVAKKAGRIERLAIIRGTSMVKEGDLVAAGDLLIAGYQVFKDMDGSLVWKEISANGRVEAVTGYEAMALEPLITWQCESGATQRWMLALRWKGRLYPLIAWGKIHGNAYREVRRKRLVNGRNPSTLVELVIDNYQEVHWRKQYITFNEAMVKAKREVSESLKASVPKTARVLRVWEDWTIEGNILYYRRVMEVVEDIGIPRPRERE